MKDISHSHVWLDGRLLPAAEAHLPIGDRGFRYGDGLFETVRVTDGLPEFWNAHMARLEAGMQALHFPALPHSFAAAARALLSANQMQQGVLRIAISRGVGGRGYLPAVDAQPMMLIESSPLPAAPNHSLTLWHSAQRRPGPEHLPTQHKLSNALGSVLARMETEEHRCDEALLTDAQGHIAEASAANILWQDEAGQLWTPALESGAVAGIAREILLSRLPIQTCLAPLEALRGASAVILCNSLRHAMPVAALKQADWHWESAALAHRCTSVLQEAAQASRADFA